MNAGQLKRALASVPDHMEIMIETQEEDAYFRYVGAETAEVREVTFKAEDVPKKEWAKDECFIISEVA